MKFSPNQALWLALFITAGSPIAGKFTVDYMSPSFVLIFGTLTTLLIYAPWLTKNKLWGKLFDKEIRSRLSVMGLFGTALPFLLLLIALRWTTPSNSAILNQAESVYSIIFAMIFLKEKPVFKQIIGTLMIVSGAVLILAVNGYTPMWKGDLLVLATVWMFQVSHIAAKKLPADISVDFITAARGFYGFIWSAVIALIGLPLGMDITFKISGPSFISLLYIAVFVYTLRNKFWYEAIRNMPLAKATAVILSYPVFTYVISLAVGFDEIRLYQICGLILALSGAYMVTLLKKS
ncbi:DMT family transporter [Candidatus Proelusimicrobium volucris]|uniref:DMT family transporter n=1 Tax=Candidatus Proelusimicrobium volucris TaxID=3416225 RepID=UPI003D0FD042